MDYATDAFILFDDDATVLDVNRQACENLGYTREELIGKHPSDFDVTLDQAFIERLRQRMLAGEVVTFETRHKRKNGTSFPVEVRVGYFEQQAGRRYLSLVRDITERKQAEDELRASEERFRILVDHASDAFFLYNEDGTVLDVNRQACESLGYSRDELIGMTAFDYGPDLTPALLQRIRDRLRSGRTVIYDGRHRRKDGTEFPVEVRIRPFWREGQLLAVSLDRDITQRKRAENELRASEERFRTLLQFSFDVYWETDAQHRTVRQEFDRGPCLRAGCRSAKRAGNTLILNPTPRPGAGTARRSMRTCRSEISSSRDLRPTEADRIGQSLGCRYLTRRDALSATEASDATSPSERGQKRRSGAAKPTWPKHRS